MLTDGRASVRQKEHSKIVIAGVDVNGSAFEEMTEARDISEEGISFYLNHSIWINTHFSFERRLNLERQQILELVHNHSIQITRFGME